MRMPNSLTEYVHYLHCLVNSTTLSIIFGTMGVVTLFAPWVVYVGTGMWNGGEIIRVSGIGMLLSIEYNRSVMLFYSLSCAACIVTPFVTRVLSRRSWRGPLYAFYISPCLLTIYDVTTWIRIPRMFIPEATFSLRLGIGISIVWIVVFGFAFTAAVAFLEKHPRNLRLDTFFAGICSGIAVLYSFFKVPWVFHPLKYVSGYTLTGFDLANHYSDELRRIAVPYLGTTFPQMQALVWPVLLYSVATFAVFAAVASMLDSRFELSRVVQILCGAVLVVVGLSVVASAQDLQIENGVGLVGATGFFLIVYNSIFLLSKCLSQPKTSTRRALILAALIFIGSISVVYNQRIERTVYSNEYFNFLEKWPFLSRLIVQNNTELSVFNFYTPANIGGAQDLTLSVRTNVNLTILVESMGGCQPYPSEKNVWIGEQDIWIRFFHEGPHKISVRISEVPTDQMADVYMRLEGLTYQKSSQVITIDDYPYSPLGWTLITATSVLFIARAKPTE